MPKVTTFVRMEKEIVIPDDQTYEVVGIIDHVGNSPLCGHYVTYLKQDSGQWKLFDDESSKSCTFKQANNRNNYLILFKKKSVISASTDDEELSIHSEKHLGREQQETENQGEPMNSGTIPKRSTCRKQNSENQNTFDSSQFKLDIDKEIENIKAIAPSQRTSEQKKKTSS